MVPRICEVEICRFVLDPDVDVFLLLVDAAVLLMALLDVLRFRHSDWGRSYGRR